MNIIDVVFILLLIYGAIQGFKKGFTHSLISCIGLTVITILSYLLKNPVSKVLYSFLPFFKFGGIIKGVTVLNILLYEVLAFLLVFSIFMVFFKVVLLASKMFEKILKYTIILGIPSKILGMIVGVIEYFIISFIVFFVLSLPVLDVNISEGSKYKDTVLTKVPILSSLAHKTITIVDRFADIKDKYRENTNANAFNLETLDLLLEYKVVSVENIDSLIKRDKLTLDNVESVLGKYRKET